MKQNCDEVQTWDDFRHGDAKAFATLYQTFIQPLYFYALGVTSDKDLIKDCLHDLFVELWKNHANLGPTTSVKFYLMASIKRKIVRHIDNQVRHSKQNQGYMIDFIEDSPSQESFMIQSEHDVDLHKKLFKSMHGLSKRQREGIHLKFFQNLDTDQISESMNINPQSVYNLVFGALRVLKEQLKQKSFHLH